MRKSCWSHPLQVSERARFAYFHMMGDIAKLMYRCLMSCHFFLIVLWDLRSCALNKHRKAGSAFSRLPVGLQAVQEVLPTPACLFNDTIFLSATLMPEDCPC